jgi:hypothetical protein
MRTGTIALVGFALTVWAGEHDARAVTVGSESAEAVPKALAFWWDSIASFKFKCDEISVDASYAPLTNP